MFTVGQLRKRLASYPDDTLILTLGDLFAPSTVQAAHAAFSSRVSPKKSSTHLSPSITAQNIRRRRESLNLTQIQLSTLLNYRSGNGGYVSFVESGRIRQPRLNTLAKFAKALNCSIEDLTQGEKE